MNERFIVINGDGFYGNWGVGNTEKMARTKLKKADKKLASVVFRFYSNLPFAPADRKAHGNEADCWIGRDGSLNWLRCKRERITV